ncbi:hypothetical protein X801_08468, partial [Opisthorchis viverrini]
MGDAPAVLLEKKFCRGYYKFFQQIKTWNKELAEAAKNTGAEECAGKISVDGLILFAHDPNFDFVEHWFQQHTTYTYGRFPTENYADNFMYTQYGQPRGKSAVMNISASPISWEREVQQICTFQCACIHRREIYKPTILMQLRRQRRNKKTVLISQRPTLIFPFSMEDFTTPE